jgi:hypothetical protein
MVFSISRRKGAGRRWREKWPTKIDANWNKHCCCCWFSQKWPSNRIKNDNRIFEHLQDCSPSDSERRFWKEKVVCTFCSTLLDTWAKGRSSQILPRHYRDGRGRQFFLNKIITGDETWCFVYDPETKRQSSNGLLRHPLGRRNKFHVDNFFRLSMRSAQRIRTRGKNSKCRIL